MSISLSFMDLKLIDELANFNSIQLLDPKLDNLVKSCLANIGFDVSKELEYIPSKHRSLQGTVSVDYVVVGEISRDKKFRHQFDALTRIVVAGMEDASLGKELSNLMGRTRSYEPEEGSRPMSKKEKQYRIDNDFDSDEDNYSDYVEEDYEETLKQIQQLTELRDFIRKGN